MAIAVRTGAILVFLSVFPGAERVSGQRAPCYQCEDYKEKNPQTSPYQQIRTHCSYPCECEDREPTCPPDVSIIRDGCGCCPICASQLGQPCDGSSVCDDRKGLVCRYPYIGATVGVCQATTGLPCMVSNKTYNHGETFHMDCRTQCSCQNGTYACSSLCPNENISPRGACTHPRLVEVPDQCCREWMCDSTEAEHPPVCKQEFTSWSPCSAPCGLGISQRISNLNQDCVLQNETRICQLRPCEAGMLSLEQHARHHHIRKGHECKATQRVSGPVRLRFGPCRSKKRYRPKFCGSCDDKVGDGCCSPQLSTTIKVEFICDSIRRQEDPNEILLDLIEPGRDLWWPDDLLAIGKQQQQQAASQSTTTSSYQDNGLSSNSTTNTFSNLYRLIKNYSKNSGVSKKQKKIPYYDLPAKANYNFKPLPSVSKEDMHLLENKNKLDEPLLGADVLVYEPGYNEKNYRIPDSKSLGVDLVTLSMNNDNEVDDGKSFTSMQTSQQMTTESTTTETTTPKPKKKRKKKPRKAFTSWLEFRDEEYQMDEYEDEEESVPNRKKRSLDPLWELGGKIIKRIHRDGDLDNENATNNFTQEEDKRRLKRGSFREGPLEDDEDDDDDEEEDEEDDDEEDDEDDEEDDDRELPGRKTFIRRKRGVQEDGKLEGRGRKKRGSFREGKLEETSNDEDYEDDDERDDEEDSDDEDDDDEDEDEDDDREMPERKPLYYTRRKREVSKVLDYKSLENIPKSPQFLSAQEKLKRKKLRKEKEGKYKNQIERKSNLLKKIMNEEKRARNAKGTKVVRVFPLNQRKEMEKHNQEAKKRKVKKGKETGRRRSELKLRESPGKKEQKFNLKKDSPLSNNEERPTVKGQSIDPLQKKENVKTLSKLERIVKERNNTFNNTVKRTGQLDSSQDHVTRPHNQEKMKKETFFHTAGKVHKSRTKRHAPRPPWTDDEGIESEDLTWGDHSVSFSVQWIVKCHCDRDCGLETTTASSELNNNGEIILRRVHRTAPP